MPEKTTPDTAYSNDHNSLKGVRILIAEDEDSSFRIIDKLLSDKGINVIRAVNGKEAVELVNKCSGLQLVVMDIKMPIMNGIEASREIRRIKPELPIIATSAFTMPGDKQVFKEAGCVDFIPKPIKEDLLFEKLNQYIN